MKKSLKSLSVILIIAMFATMLFNLTAFAEENEYDGKTIILYTGNIRGDIDVLKQIAFIKSDYEAKGAEVILADTGNYLQGTVYTTYDSGETMIKLMTAAGYDVVGIGSHEFDFGTGKVGVEQHEVLYQDGTLGSFLSAAPFHAVSANTYTQDGNLNAYTPNCVIESALTIGFYGITNPDAVASDIIITGAEPTISQQTEELADCDIIIGLSNVGNIKSDGIIIDIAPETGFVVGSIVIDNETKKVSKQEVTLSDSDKDVKAETDKFKAEVDKEYPQALIAKSEVILNGSMKDVRSADTNLGNLWTDALLWFATEGGIEKYIEEDDIAAGNTEIAVDDDHIVALWNGGNLRDYLNSGDVVLKDLQRVLPYPNRVSVVYLTGAQLLEYLEAASQGLPYSNISSAVCASFMQVAGIEYSVKTSIPYDAGELYRPNWYKADSINRVTIESVNGKELNETDIYAVITSNANYNGMDASYVCLDRGDESFITTAMVYDVVMMYIQQGLNGVIDDTYASPQGRITIDSSAKHVYTDVSDSEWYSEYVGYVTANGLMSGVTHTEFAPESEVTRGDFINLLYRAAGYPSVEVTDRFTDIPADSVYARAVEWAAVNAITYGATETEFEPDEILTNQQMWVLIYRYFGTPDVDGGTPPVQDIEEWAVNAAIYCYSNGLTPDGVPYENVTRADAAFVIKNIIG